MRAPVLVLLLALLLGGLLYAAHVLWVAAVIVVLAWLVGRMVSRGQASNVGSGQRQ